MTHSAHQFETERLSMRLLDERDKAFYLSLYLNPTVMRYISAPYEKERLIKCFKSVLKQHSKQSGHFSWLITDKEKHSLGIMGLNIDKQHVEQAEMGIMLAPEAFKRSVAYEAIGSLTEFGFSKMMLEKIYCYFSKDNQAVINLSHRLNYKIDMPLNDTEKAMCSMDKANFKALFIKQHDKTTFN